MLTLSQLDKYAAKKYAPRDTEHSEDGVNEAAK